MICDRCHGCLVREAIYRQGAWWWRCYNCGERTDGAILLNRAEQAAAAADRLVAMERDLKDWSEWMAKVPGGAMPPAVFCSSVHGDARS